MTNKELKEAFLKDLEALLKKHEVTISAKVDFIGYHGYNEYLDIYFKDHNSILTEVSYLDSKMDLLEVFKKELDEMKY
jgi:hypothetical protein